MFKRVLSYFFGWETVYLTNNLDKYAGIRGRLMDNGVKAKTKITNNSSGGIGNSVMPNSTNYEIFVRKEDVHRANQIIHSQR